MQSTWRMGFLEPQAKLGCALHKMGRESPTLSQELQLPFGPTGQDMFLKWSLNKIKYCIPLSDWIKHFRKKVGKFTSPLCSPVVVITPETGSLGIGLGGFQEMNQLPTFSEITKYQAHVTSPKRWPQHKCNIQLWCTAVYQTSMESTKLSKFICIYPGWLSSRIGASTMPRWNVAQSNWTSPEICSMATSRSVGNFCLIFILTH